MDGTLALILLALKSRPENHLRFHEKKSTKFAIIFFPYRKYGNSSLLEAEEERERRNLLGEHFYSHLSVSGSPNTMCPKNPEKSAIERSHNMFP